MNKRKKILLSILKEFSEKRIPNENDYELSKNDFLEIVDMAQNAGYIQGAKFVRGGKGNKFILGFFDGTIVTKKGLDYIDENKIALKLYKEIKDWAEIVIP